MTIYPILRRIKKLKVKELKELDEKLKIIIQKSIFTPIITIDDIEEALKYCIFHFKGGMIESLGYEECPCKCYCQACEMIPEHPIGIEMQKIAENITEKNVFDEYLERTTNGQSSKPCNSDNSITSSGCK